MKSATHRPRAPRAHRRLALLPMAALLVGLVSCSEQAEALTTPCGVVLDGSGSGAADAGGFDAEAKLKSELIPFLTEQKCGTVDFAPITRVSQISSCKVKRVDLDPPHNETTDQDSQRRQARARAAAGALQELECARRDRPGSDVWGGLDRIAATLPTDGPKAKLLVVSDFEQADPEFNLGEYEIETEQRRQQAIDSQVKRRGLPGIEGMDVYPVGFGMQYGGKPSQYERFEAFWQEFLEGRAKAHVHNDYK